MEKPFNFDTFPDRRTTESLKWRAYAKDVLPMWVADMDFLSPPKVIEALRARVEHGIYGYAIDPPSLKQAIMTWLEARYQWRVSEEEIVFVPSVVSGFNLVALALKTPGSGLLIQTPVYPPFLNVARQAGMKDQRLPLSRDAAGRYYVDGDRFRAALTPETRMFLLCNPHNPVGRVFTREELWIMAEACLEQDVVICSDEIHCDLTYSGHVHIPIATLDEAIARKTVTLMSPSKTFNLAGLKFAFAVVPDPALRKTLKQLVHDLGGGMNIMGLVAAEAAYTRGAEWLQHLLKILESNRNYLYEYVQNELPGLEMQPPEATYLAWLDCRGLDLQPNPYEFFLNEARVALNNGRDFGAEGRGFVRLNFGCPRATLEQGLLRMKAALERTKMVS
ncbi:PatB family C-S lyase [uncultured Thermanaerothrix sp.]|uniref:MalY/PatB family protein n=1 Tax=uncultured Thermanaerothrix sp. TaxID=1195149 RepID=UPI00262C4713|nr:PatB family C-S lyase [uncultured Thermanaerothrix sp.]